jgi:hypothetical protein
LHAVPHAQASPQLQPARRSLRFWQPQVHVAPGQDPQGHDVGVVVFGMIRSRVNG